MSIREILLKVSELQGVLFNTRERYWYNDNVKAACNELHERLHKFQNEIIILEKSATNSDQKVLYFQPQLCSLESEIVALFWNKQASR